jgi:predicted DNA binding CopG/RHH family protein
VALVPDLVAEIKEAAAERGVPYQVLLRMFIIEGFKSWQKSA